MACPALFSNGSKDSKGRGGAGRRAAGSKEAGDKRGTYRVASIFSPKGESDKNGTNRGPPNEIRGDHS